MMTYNNDPQRDSHGGTIAGMTITIHRELDLTGGCLVEYECRNWRIFVEYGNATAESAESSLLLEKLLSADLAPKTMLVTDYPMDYVDRINQLLPDMTIYVAPKSSNVQSRSSDKLSPYTIGSELKFGPFTIVPANDNGKNDEATSWHISAMGIKIHHIKRFLSNKGIETKQTGHDEQSPDTPDYIILDATELLNPSVSIPDLRDKIQKMLRLSSPHSIIPLHPTDPMPILDIIGDLCPVTLLADGEAISPCEDEACATIYEIGQSGKLISHNIGSFFNDQKAKFMIDHTHYNKPVLGYEIYEEIDFGPTLVVVLDADKKPLNKYTRGDHRIGKSRFQEPSPFAPGEKVLAVINKSEEVVPAIVLGPISLKYLKENLDQDSDCDMSWAEYRKIIFSEYDDWNWDSVAVHPMKKVEMKWGTLLDTEIVPRVHLFPYRDLDPDQE